MARPKSNGEGEPLSEDEALGYFVVLVSRIVTARHRDWDRESLFRAGICLGLQMGVEKPSAASRYVRALQTVVPLVGSEFGKKMAEALELLSNTEKEDPKGGRPDPSV